MCIMTALERRAERSSWPLKLLKHRILLLPKGLIYVLMK